MPKFRGTIIVAMNPDHVIGRIVHGQGDLPWHYPEDLKRFKSITLGHTVIMGKTTFESITHRFHTPLPGRKNIVISRSLNITDILKNISIPEGTSLQVYPSLQEAIEQTPDVESIDYIGGAKLYEEALKYAAAIDLTHVPDILPLDHQTVFFPAFDKEVFRSQGKENIPNSRLLIETFCRL